MASPEWHDDLEGLTFAPAPASGPWGARLYEGLSWAWGQPPLFCSVLLSSLPSKSFKRSRARRDQDALQKTVPVPVQGYGQGENQVQGGSSQEITSACKGAAGDSSVGLPGAFPVDKPAMPMADSRDRRAVERRLFCSTSCAVTTACALPPL